MRQIKQRVRAVLMEKSAPARAAHGHHVGVGSRRSGGWLNGGGGNAVRGAIAQGHHVGVGSRRSGGWLNGGGGNAVRGAIAQNRFAIGVAANQADAREWKIAAELGEIFGDVVRDR